MSEGKNKNSFESKKKTVLAVIISSIALALGITTALILVNKSKSASYTPPQEECKDLPNGMKHCFYPVVDKPILYFYPTEETDIFVSFEKPENLITTYPKYYGGWNIKATPDGTLTDPSGNNYYALYWDENSNFIPDQDTAFYVTKDDAIDFLEEKLSYIGLNDRERNEFIMYWLPILENNEQSLVRFAYTEDLQSDNKLNISPAPESLFRLRIFVNKTDNNPNLPEPKLQKFERKGFSALEWGGSHD